MAAHLEFRRLIDELGVDYDENQFTGKHGDDQRDPNYWMYAAIDHANASVKLGLVSHAIIAASLDYKVFDESTWEMLAPGHHYDPLLNAVEDFAARERRAEIRIRDNVANERRLHVCAAEGCGVHAVHKQGLLACGGRCSLAVKPHYCSKGCQTKDWPRHKPLCKPSEELPLNARETVAAVSAKKRTSALEHAPASRDKCAREWKIRAEPGPDHFVELDLEDIIGQPGYGTLRVDSHTIAPEDLRALRDEWELMLRQYAKNMAKELAGHATTGDDESSGGGVDAVSG
ncbi:hypothetical protein K466DRAFT_601951 [Polyporus arcularius HHB13444]|uniref:MYND-type domain-containing protein n=1 Tax=Polyporus arcularius HHB13444 TaxID=1314778 RepID=A0A5C3P689_9APHY|nr:hypothetical protein K466DRAFT_601951 [Polyporus arcularius HHB13444]